MHCLLRWLLISLLLVLEACVSVTTQPRQPIELERFPPPRHPELARPRPAPEPPVERIPVPPPEPAPASVPKITAPPAVIALRDEARAHLDHGDLDNAAVALERALAIRSDNPELWHGLAEVRLKQGQPELAEDLAKKSNVLARGNPGLIRANWLLIAEARRRKGDPEGAAEAEREAVR
jgi:tetratricopeptide (TPR) repeat protein